MKIGYIGLGKMGKNMVLRLLENGIEVVVWNRSPEPLAEVKVAGASVATDIKDLLAQLPSPKIVWLMLPAGEVTDGFVSQLHDLLSVGDMIIDGANSFYKDTLRRFSSVQDKGIRYVDIGVSGGPRGAREGACLMIGGSEADVMILKPVLEASAIPGAWALLGPVGAGHFAKMVHNGIEYGMMQAIGEGAAVLKYSQFNFNMAQVFDLYNKRSVIESRLVGWGKEALTDDANLGNISSKIKASGEGEWTVNVAHEEKVTPTVIEASLQIRNQSETVTPDSPDGYRNKMVSALRGKFGGHEVSTDDKK